MRRAWLALWCAACCAAAFGASVRVAWDPPADTTGVLGYELGYGEATGERNRRVGVPFGTHVAETQDLAPGTWYFAVRSTGADGAVSDWSEEISTTLAGAALTQPLPQIGIWARYARSIGMAAPTFVAEYASVFNNNATPKTLMNAVAVSAGDVIVMVGAHENQEASHLLPPSYTENGAGDLANSTNNNALDYAIVSCATYTAANAETLTTTAVKGANQEAARFGANAIRFSGSGGIGNIATGSGASGAPSFSITTTQANSAIVVIVADWNATSGSQTFTSNGGAGSATALTGFPGNDLWYGVAIAYYADAGTAGAKTVGMSAPSNQKWRAIAIEVKGSGDAATASYIPGNRPMAGIIVR